MGTLIYFYIKMSFNEKNDVGKVLIDVQNEIKSLKSILSNLPSFPNGNVPPQFSKLHNRLEMMEKDLQIKKHGIINDIVNECDVQQKLPRLTTDDKNTSNLKTKSI